jgi:hypothetical protein
VAFRDQLSLMEALSLRIWKNGDREMKRAESIMIC